MQHKAVWVVIRNGFLHIQFNDTSTYSVPRALIEHVCSMPVEKARKVEITGDGSGLRWPDIDFDLSIDNMLQGVYGSYKHQEKLPSLIKKEGYNEAI